MTTAKTTQAVEPDKLAVSDLSRHIRNFRAFLGSSNSDAAREAMQARASDGNRFRELALRRKLPWPYAFEHYDRATMRGARPLRIDSCPPEVWHAAMAGLALARVGPTIPAGVKSRMRSRLLDLDGRAWPVVMEWDSAHFFLRHGYRITWTSDGERGPEFVCERDGVAFGVECKRVGWDVGERTRDSTAFSLVHGVARVFDALNVSADLIVETQLTTERVDEGDLAERLRARLEGTPNEGRVRIDIEPYGTLSGELHRNTGVPDALALREINRRIRAVKPGGRYSTVTLPIDRGPTQGYVFLELRGPRLSDDEVDRHVASEMNHGGDQLARTMPGVLIVEFEGVADAAEFAAQRYVNLSTALFARYPTLAAIVWRCPRELSARGMIDQWGLVHWNRECEFPEGLNIVLND